MTYTPALIVHIAGGIVGVVSGFTALFARKGSFLHRKSGDVFVIAMLSMAAAGGYVAFIKAQPPNVMGGIFTFYLVGTAWLTVKRGDNETGRLEFGFLLLALVAAVLALVLGWRVTHRAAGQNAGDSPVLYIVFGSAILLAAAGDVRMLIRGGVAGAKRLVRHLWRMCIALFVATGSFFLGTASDPVLRRTGLRATIFTPEIRRTHLPEVPVLIVVVLTIYWVLRVMFANVYKSPGNRLRAASEMTRS